MRELVVLAAALVVLPPLSSLAEDADVYGPEQGDWEFLLSATGSNDNEYDAGEFGLAAALGFFITDGFELGGRHNMVFFDSDAVDATYIATTRAFLDYHIDLDRFQPFLGANIGLRYGENVDEVGTVAPELGVKFYALENTFVLGQMEYQIFFDDVDDLDDRADDGQFVYTLGIGFNF